MILQSNKYSRVRNKHTPRFINFWKFFQGLQSYYGLKRLKFYYIHTFAHFKGLPLFFLSNFPEDTFIQGATSIPDSRVVEHLELQFCADLESLTQAVSHIRVSIRNLNKFCKLQQSGHIQDQAATFPRVPRLELEVNDTEHTSATMY